MEELAKELKKDENYLKEIKEYEMLSGNIVE